MARRATTALESEAEKKGQNFQESPLGVRLGRVQLTHCSSLLRFVPLGSVEGHFMLWPLEL